MIVIIVYVLIVLLGNTAAALIAMEVENFSNSASIFVFFGLFTAVLWFGWLLAVHLTERYIHA